MAMKPTLLFWHATSRTRQISCLKTALSLKHPYTKEILKMSKSDLLQEAKAILKDFHSRMLVHEDIKKAFPEPPTLATFVATDMPNFCPAQFFSNLIAYADLMAKGLKQMPDKYFMKEMIDENHKSVVAFSLALRLLSKHRGKQYDFSSATVNCFRKHYKYAHLISDTDLIPAAKQYPAETLHKMGIEAQLLHDFVKNPLRKIVIDPYPKHKRPAEVCTLHPLATIHIDYLDKHPLCLNLDRKYDISFM